MLNSLLYLQYLLPFVFNHFEGCQLTCCCPACRLVLLHILHSAIAAKLKASWRTCTSCDHSASGLSICSISEWPRKLVAKLAFISKGMVYGQLDILHSLSWSQLNIHTRKVTFSSVALALAKTQIEGFPLRAHQKRTV